MTAKPKKPTHPWRAGVPLSDPDAERRQEQICPRHARPITGGHSRARAGRPRA